MTDLLLTVGISNLFISFALAIVAWTVQKTGKHPLVAHLLWLIVFVKLVTPPIVTVPLVAIPGTPTAVSEVAADSSRPGPVAPLNPAADLRARGDDWFVVSAVTWFSTAERTKSGLALLWLAGSASVLGWSLIRIYRFNRILRMASRKAPRQLQSTASGLAHCLGIASPPAIYMTSAHLSPLVWWLGGRVRILIPEALPQRMEPGQLQWILAHELAHVKRRDHMVRWLEWTACVCFWWNPVVWWARRHLRANEEVCCDALVLASLEPAPRTYANSLMTVVEYLATPALRPPAMASEINSGGFLERRFKMIVSDNPVRTRPRWLQACVLICALIILPLGIASAQDYDKIAKRLKKAVKKGEITQEQSNIMMTALKKSAKAPKKAKLDYDAVNREIKMALKAGKITEEEANAKWAAIRKKAAAREKKTAPQRDERDRRVDRIAYERRLEAYGMRVRAAILAGEMTKEEGRAKMDAYRKRADGAIRERTEGASRERTEGATRKRRITVEEYKGIETRVKIAVDKGMITAEEGEARLIAARKMIADDNRRERSREKNDWDGIKRRIESAVERGDMTREEADKKYEALKKRIRTLGYSGGK